MVVVMGSALAHKEIGTAIKELREALGSISQERFARKLGTTTRTVSRWEAAESLSPQILSRLRSIAISVSARDAAEFFESKLREDLDWEPDVSEGYATPATEDEQALISEFLKRYRANDKAIQPLLQEFLLSIVAQQRFRALQLERQPQKGKHSLADLMRPGEKASLMRSLRDLMNITPALSDVEIVRAFLSGRRSGEKTKK
jgi:transcriptional regulator with XRE-family HTH domain